MNKTIDAWARDFSTLVFEGVDRSGKTSNASILCARHNFRCIHSPRTPAKTNLLDRYRLILASAGPLVLDRSFISEWVYGSALRNKSRVTLTEVIELTKTVASRRGAIIYFSASLQTIQRRLADESGQREGDGAAILQLQQRYDLILKDLTAYIPIFYVATDQD